MFISVVNVMSLSDMHSFVSWTSIFRVWIIHEWSYILIKDKKKSKRAEMYNSMQKWCTS